MNLVSRPPVACPRCSSLSTVPIVYGLPSIDHHERAQRGEFVLGGCLIGLHEPDPDPSHCCSACGASFNAASGHIAAL